MKSLILSLVVVAASSVAHAELLVPKGTKATIDVEYSYSAVGSKPDKYDPREWKVTRRMQLTAELVAGKPQELAQLRAMEAGQLADLQAKQKSAVSAHTKMKPMMNDM